MLKKKRNPVFVIALIACIVLSTTLHTKKTAAENPEPFFNIILIAPATSPARNQWATLMVEQLPKIGIGVDLEWLGWAQIYPRTWDYPGPFPIPSYDKGGYDILFLGWGWGLDFDPTGIYDTAGIVPNGDNFYQYSSQEMDWAISNYTSTYASEDRIVYAHDIQALLYEDLPQITLIYPKALYPMNKEFSGWDGVLWTSSYQPMENWSIGGKTEFHYASPADFVDFHIYQYDSVYDAQWLHQIYNGLIERQIGTHDWRNRLATSFTSTDGLTWIVDINPNAVWADGIPLTAYDVNYSYNLIIDPDFGCPDRVFYERYIDNTSINIINDYQVEFTFLQPYVFQEVNLAVDLIPEHIWGSIAPADQEAQAITWASSDPTKLFGAGPYKLADYDGINQIIHLEVNPYFDDWSGITPNFDDIYFEFYSNKEGALSALATGALDMVDAQYSPQIAEVAGLVNVTYVLVDDPGTHEMAINMEHPYLGTGEKCPISDPESAKHIRKAISHMVPRKIIIEEILDGIGREGVTGWSSVAHGFDESLKPYEYNISLAVEHMQAAGYKYPDGFLPITPTTIILSFSFETIICSLALTGGVILIIRYKKRRDERYFA